MVKSTPNPKKPKIMGRIMYSAIGLSVIGGAVAVLGAPFKWVLPHLFKVTDMGAAGPVDLSPSRPSHDSPP